MPSSKEKVNARHKERMATDLEYRLRKAQESAKQNEKRSKDPVYLENKRITDAKYRANNRIKINAQIEEIHKANPNKYKNLHKEWKSNNPEKVKASSAIYRKRHRNELNIKNRKYQKTHPEVINAKTQRRRTAKTNAGGAYTSEQWIALCDKYHNRCLCCGKKRKLTADHVIPVSKGGSSDISNIQPLCMPCNAHKHTGTIDFRKQY